MKYGYARVSSKEQNLQRQLETLGKEGISEKHIYKEKASGKDMEREELKRLLEVVKRGDVIVVADITRLARNLHDTVNLISRLEIQGVSVQCVKEGLQTSNEMGKMLIHFLSIFSEMERNYIKERQRQGIEIARREGRIKGRPRINCDDFNKIYQRYLGGTLSMNEALKLLGCSKATFYRRKKEYEKQQNEQLLKKIQQNIDDEIIDF